MAMLRAIFKVHFLKLVWSALAFTFFVLSNANLFSQQSWYWKQPMPTGNLLYSVHFTSQQTGYAAGIRGTIVKVINGGINRNILNSGTLNDLYEIFFISNNTGFAVGKAGTILRTTNSGDNWINQTGITNYNLHDISFPDSNTGYIAGLNGAILKTTNAGANWILISSGTNAPLFCINFLNANTGAAGGYNIIITTTNGGQNWNIQNANIFPSTAVIGITQTDSNTILAAGNSMHGAFYKTTNAGNTWYALSLELPLLYEGSVDLVRSSAFINSSTGFIVTDFGTILRTSSGGSSWQKDSSLRPAYQKTGLLQDVSIDKYGNQSIAGAGGTIFQSSNYGTDWIAVSGNKRDVRSSCFINSSTGYCCGESGTILKTSDSGSNWKLLSSGASELLQGIFFTNEATGYAAGRNGIIIKTTDSGRSWKKQFSKIHLNLSAIFFSNRDTGFAIGNDTKYSPVILRTTDGGKKWNYINHNLSSLSLNDIDFANKENGIIACDNDCILVTSDGGVSWNLSQPDFENYNSVSFADSANAMIACDNGRIFKSTNGGQDWNALVTGIFVNLHDLEFLNPEYAVAVGDNGTVVETTNGGASWIQKPKVTSNNFYSAKVLDKGNLIVFGDYGTILKSETITDIYSESKFENSQAGNKLFQNYPNPFNPSTLISFHLRDEKKIKLILYNSSGEEIKILFDGNMSEGTHSIIFEPESLASGIYYCGLMTGNMITGIRKMVYIK